MHIVVLGNGENPAVRVRSEDLAYIFLDGRENCRIAETRLCGLIAIFGQSRQRVDKADPLVVAVIDVVRTHPFGILRTDPVELSIFKRRDKVIGESFRQIHVALLQDRSIYMQIPPTHPFCEKLVQHVCELPVAPEVEIAVPYRDGETALRHIGGRREYNQSLRSFCLDTYGQCGTDGLSEFLLEKRPGFQLRVCAGTDNDLELCQRNAGDLDTFCHNADSFRIKNCVSTESIPWTVQIVNSHQMIFCEFSY